MTIKRESRRSGVIVQEVLVSDALDSADAASVNAEWDIVDPGAEAMLQGYVKAARHMLETTPRHTKNGGRSAQWMAARSTTIHAREAIKYLRAGDAEMAVWNALVAAHYAWIADVKAVEPTLATGERVRRPHRASNMAKKEEAMAREAKWQRLANEQWATNQHADKSAKEIARLIAQPLEKPDTIRRRIKKMS